LFGRSIDLGTVKTSVRGYSDHTKRRLGGWVVNSRLRDEEEKNLANPRGVPAVFLVGMARRSSAATLVPRRRVQGGVSGR
jgi:hypothetical protein